MKHQGNNAIASVQHLQPRESFGADVVAVSPFNQSNLDFETNDIVCSGLEEISRHLRWLEDDYLTERFDKLEARAKNCVLLADQLGLRRLGQVAADVIYCLDDPSNAALPATLSRLMRLMTQALDHAADPMSQI